MSTTAEKHAPPHPEMSAEDVADLAVDFADGCDWHWAGCLFESAGCRANSDAEARRLWTLADLCFAYARGGEVRR